MSMSRSKPAPQLSAEPRFWVVALLTVVLYFIAGSIGSGWMFLLSAALLTTAICAVILPCLTLANVKVTQRGPDSAIAGQPVVFKVTLQPKWELKTPVNSMLVPQLLLVRQDFPDTVLQGAKSLSGTPSDAVMSPLIRWLLGDSLIKQTKKLVTTRKLFDAFIDTVEEPKSVSIEQPGLRRGVHKLGQVSVRTSFPLGLVWMEKQFQCDETITVYPAQHAIEGFFLYRIKALGAGAFGCPREGTTAQSIFTRSVRQYVRGDSPRSIHWTSTARMGRLMVREFDAEGLPYFDIGLDLTANWSSPEQFELAISTVASLFSLGQRMGLNPELRLIPSLEQLELQLPPVLPGYELQMEILARLNPIAGNDPIRKSLDAARMRVRPEERTLVIVSPQGDASERMENSFVVEIGDQSNLPIAPRDAIQRASTVAADGFDADGTTVPGAMPSRRHSPASQDTLVSSLDELANL